MTSFIGQYKSFICPTFHPSAYPVIVLPVVDSSVQSLIVLPGFAQLLIAVGIAVVCWLPCVPAIRLCISRTDLHRQLNVLPH